MSDDGKTEQELAGAPAWLTPGVGGIGIASLLSDLGHEVPTSLLPSLLISTLTAPASALGVIEGISDGLAGVARLGGGALADDPARRRSIAVGGYAGTAVPSGLIGAAGTVWQVGVLRAGAWTARGLRVPARNALLADLVPPTVYGRAYGFERAMDNLGAIGGPLLAIGIVGLIGVRSAILLSIIPGLLAALAIIYAIRHTAAPAVREHQPIRLHIRPLLYGQLGRLLAAARVLTAGAGCFLIAYVGFALSGESVALLGGCFILAGVGIGCAETAQSAAVAQLAPEQLRGSAFGLLAGVQAIGNLAASAIAGVLWTAVSPAAAFTYVAAWMAVAVVGLLRATPPQDPLRGLNRPPPKPATNRPRG